MHGSAQWNYYYSLLEAYYKEHGNIDIPNYFKIDGKKVGLWLEYQKQAYRGKNGYVITQERIERLEELGIHWSNKSDVWDRHYSLLEEYYKEHGNIDVPQSYEVDGIKLGVWLRNQRSAYRGIGKRKIKSKQIERLEKLGMKWNLRSNNWEEKYSLLEEYYKEHGDIDVPQSYVVNGIKLGIWVSTQKQTYNKGMLTSKQIERLEKLGMKWDSKVALWEENYVLLEKYYKEHGNIDVPQLYEVNGVKLGRWLSTQRQAYKGNNCYKIIPDQIEKLENLGMKWNSHSSKWEENYTLLK